MTIVIPSQFVNNGDVWVQEASAGAARGKPDSVEAFDITENKTAGTARNPSGTVLSNNINFYEYSLRSKKWTPLVSAQITAHPWSIKGMYGPGTIVFADPRGTAGGIGGGVVHLTSAGEANFNYTEDEAKSMGNPVSEAYFYATNKKYDPQTTRPHGDTGGSSSGGSSGGSSPRGTTGTGTSQSTMYMLGGGALIGLLFLFTQK